MAIRGSFLQRFSGPSPGSPDQRHAGAPAIFLRRGLLGSSSSLFRDGFEHQTPGPQCGDPRKRTGSSGPSVPMQNSSFVEDQKVPLIDRLEGLKKVVYHSKLGTSYEKVMRISRLAEAIPSAWRRICRRRSTGVPPLQRRFDHGNGRRISEPAGDHGESLRRALGRKERSRPGYLRTLFAHGGRGRLTFLSSGRHSEHFRQTGYVGGLFRRRVDPDRERRILCPAPSHPRDHHILLDKKYPLSLEDLCDWSLELLAQKMERPPKRSNVTSWNFSRAGCRICSFPGTYPPMPLKRLWSSGFDDLVDLLERAQAIHDLKKEPDFEPLAVAFKRVVNISRSHAPGVCRSPAF